LIYKLFCEWFTDGWDMPDNDSEWVKMVCPFHQESRASAVISYDNDAFHCHACDWSGDALKLIMRKEDCGFQDSKRRAEDILGRSYEAILRKPGGKSSRRVFGKARPSNPRKPGGSFTFPDWIR
jgi:hypothetical protein